MSHNSTYQSDLSARYDVYNICKWEYIQFESNTAGLSVCLNCSRANPSPSMDYILILRVKPNSHQTIFLTDFQRQTKIEKSVVVGRFKKKKLVGVTWKSVGTYSNDFFFFKLADFLTDFTTDFTTDNYQACLIKSVGTNDFS